MVIMDRFSKTLRFLPTKLEDIQNITKAMTNIFFDKYTYMEFEKTLSLTKIYNL